MKLKENLKKKWRKVDCKTVEENLKKVGRKLEEIWKKIGRKLEESWKKIELFGIKQQKGRIQKKVGINWEKIRRQLE